MVLPKVDEGRLSQDCGLRLGQAGCEGSCGIESGLAG